MANERLNISDGYEVWEEAEDFLNVFTFGWEGNYVRDGVQCTHIVTLPARTELWRSFFETIEYSNSGMVHAPWVESSFNEIHIDEISRKIVSSRDTYFGESNTEIHISHDLVGEVCVTQSSVEGNPNKVMIKLRPSDNLQERRRNYQKKQLLSNLEKTIDASEINVNLSARAVISHLDSLDIRDLTIAHVFDLRTLPYVSDGDINDRFIAKGSKRLSDKNEMERINKDDYILPKDIFEDKDVMYFLTSENNLAVVKKDKNFRTVFIYPALANVIALGE